VSTAQQAAPKAPAKSQGHAEVLRQSPSQEPGPRTEIPRITAQEDGVGANQAKSPSGAKLLATKGKHKQGFDFVLCLLEGNPAAQATNPEKQWL
jgi:hypothetical protein